MCLRIAGLGAVPSTIFIPGVHTLEGCGIFPWEDGLICSKFELRNFSTKNLSQIFAQGAERPHVALSLQRLWILLPRPAGRI